MCQITSNNSIASSQFPSRNNSTTSEDKQHISFGSVDLSSLRAEHGKTPISKADSSIGSSTSYKKQLGSKTLSDKEKNAIWKSTKERMKYEVKEKSSNALKEDFVEFEKNKIDSSSKIKNSEQCNFVKLFTSGAVIPTKPKKIEEKEALNNISLDKVIDAAVKNVIAQVKPVFDQYKANYETLIEENAAKNEEIKELKINNNKQSQEIEKLKAMVAQLQMRVAQYEQVSSF